MKRIAIVSTLVCALFLSVSALSKPVSADIVDDDGTRVATGPYITFPVNTTYNSRFLTLNISFSAQLFSNVRFSATYSLDGTASVTVPLVSTPSLIWNKNRVTGSLELPELPEGSHRLSVFVEAGEVTGDSYWDRETVYFTVETIPPKIKVLSPLNQTYNETSVSLTFTLDRQVNWTGYSLDGKEIATTSGNASLAGLYNGSHNVTVYANDTYWKMGESETVSFTVAVPEPFPVVPVVAVAIVAIVATVLLPLFLRKRHNLMRVAENTFRVTLQRVGKTPSQPMKCSTLSRFFD